MVLRQTFFLHAGSRRLVGIAHCITIRTVVLLLRWLPSQCLHAGKMKIVEDGRHRERRREGWRKGGRERLSGVGKKERLRATSSVHRISGAMQDGRLNLNKNLDHTRNVYPLSLSLHVSYACSDGTAKKEKTSSAARVYTPGTAEKKTTGLGLGVAITILLCHFGERQATRYVIVSFVFPSKDEANTMKIGACFLPYVCRLNHRPQQATVRQ